MRWPRPELTRRAVLGLGAGALLSGCLRSKRRGKPAGRPDPDAALATSVRSAEVGLIAAYDAAVRSFPALSGALGPLRTEHEQHLRALPGAGPSGAPPPLPETALPDPTGALRSLLAAERSAAAARVADCLTASSRLAPLLASIGASEAAHAAALAGVRASR